MQIPITLEQMRQGPLILVNRQYPIQNPKPPFPLATMPSSYSFIQLTQIAQTQLLACLQILQAETEIIPISGYRSLAEQQQIYEDSLQEHGLAFTQKFVALPNTSEHQTGLAIDLALQQAEIDFICPEFPYHGICQTFREIAPSFGFIERYAKGKETITGIAQEPWHFRYVGTPHAEIITQYGFCLEEYHQFLQQFPVDGEHFYWQQKETEAEIFLISKEKMVSAGNYLLELPEQTNIHCSGNNHNAVIITLERRQNHARF